MVELQAETAKEMVEEGCLYWQRACTREKMKQSSGERKETGEKRRKKWNGKKGTDFFLLFQCVVLNVLKVENILALN